MKLLKQICHKVGLPMFLHKQSNGLHRNKRVYFSFNLGCLISIKKKWWSSRRYKVLVDDQYGIDICFQNDNKRNIKTKSYFNFNEAITIDLNADQLSDLVVVLIRIEDRFTSELFFEKIYLTKNFL